MRYAQASREILSILDINVWSGLDYKGKLWMSEYESMGVREKRYQALISQIRQLDPDIIGVHEANKLPAYAERLALDLSYDVIYHVGVGGIRLGSVGLPWNLREGDAILAKKDLQMEFVGRIQLSGGYVGNFASFHFSDATQILAAKVVNRNRSLYVFATHWRASVPDSPEILGRAETLRKSLRAENDDFNKVMEKIREGVDWRLSESRKTLDFIKKTAGDHPFILMGDFNAISDSREIKNLLEFGMSDAYRSVNPTEQGFTWDPETNLNHTVHYLSKLEKVSKDPGLYGELESIYRGTPKRIDYIFLGPNSALGSHEISVKSSRVVIDDVLDGVHASDHYGILAEIEFGE